MTAVTSMLAFSVLTLIAASTLAMDICIALADWPRVTSAGQG